MLLRILKIKISCLFVVVCCIAHAEGVEYRVGAHIDTEKIPAGSGIHLIIERQLNESVTYAGAPSTAVSQITLLGPGWDKDDLANIIHYFPRPYYVSCPPCVAEAFKGFPDLRIGAIGNDLLFELGAIRDKEELARVQYDVSGMVDTQTMQNPTITKVVVDHGLRSGRVPSRPYVDQLRYAGEPLNRIKTLDLKGDGWSAADIDHLARLFPDVKTLICSRCDLYALGALVVFQKMNRLELDFAGAGAFGKNTNNVFESDLLRIPEHEYTFDGLPYDAINQIYIKPTSDTAISCRSLGIWSYKTGISSPWPADYLRPFKSSDSCFPVPQREISKLLGKGDDAYRNAQYKIALEQYGQAFSINPYDQKSIAAYSLALFKENQFCKAAQVAHHGSGLPNGNATTRGAIWFNYYKALLALGNADAAKTALFESHTIKPADIKQRLLDEWTSENLAQTECSLQADWLQTQLQKIELAALPKLAPPVLEPKKVNALLIDVYGDVTVKGTDRNGNGVNDLEEFDYGNIRYDAGPYLFEAIRLDLPAPAFQPGAELHFAYKASDPKMITLREENYGHKTVRYKKLADGCMRIWTKDATESRNPQGVENGGDYITPEFVYTPAQLGFSAEKTSVLLYREILPYYRGDCDVAVMLDTPD
ncbi:MAG: hypothetical protein H7A09_01150 [Oceanospirillaceae bacterium]|nr:hypothetical protein [Oceanospirillaceae bacterium]